jgi:hypothetical protein
VAEVGDYDGVSLERTRFGGRGVVPGSKQGMMWRVVMKANTLLIHMNEKLVCGVEVLVKWEV